MCSFNRYNGAKCIKVFFVFFWGGGRVERLEIKVNVNYCCHNAFINISTLLDNWKVIKIEI